MRLGITNYDIIENQMPYYRNTFLLAGGKNRNKQALCLDMPEELLRNDVTI